MKTLDEVIKAYEICLNINETSCRDCPYTEFNAEGKWACSLCGDCTEDALHYLKEYRETVTKCNELRTGIWIPVDSETVNGRCSVCGYESHLYENDVYGEHYCPNCGAWLKLT